MRRPRRNHTAVFKANASTVAFTKAVVLTALRDRHTPIISFPWLTITPSADDVTQAVAP